MRSHAAAIAMSLCVLAPAAHAAQPIGRLFYSPEQRAEIDRAPLPSTASDATNQSLTLNGMVVRKDGKKTRWVNGVPSFATDSDVTLPKDVRVGETRDPDRGILNDSVHQSRVQIRRN